MDNVSKLAYLSREAHNLAVNQGRLIPAERHEFDSYPMTWIEGVPCFDGTRMREDQVDDVCARLEQITGRQYAVGVEQQVKLYMQQFGWRGVRVKDVCDAVAASKPIVLKYLRQWVETMEVTVKEEKTRGANGSPRKRYFWAAGPPSVPHKQLDDLRENDGLELDRANRHGSGVIHHGSAVYGAICPCSDCQGALEASFLEEERSAARRNGTNQLIPGLELRRVRREKQDMIDRRAVAAGLAAV